MKKYIDYGINMDMQIPKHIASGSKSRLFSSLKIVNKELIATSTLLAAFRIVPELMLALIPDRKLKVNKTTTLKTYTEVTLTKLKNDKKDRSDGFIYLKNINEWTAIVETKVGKKNLQLDQVSRYIDGAKVNSIDALITISNEFTPNVDQSPLKIPKHSLNKVKLYHFSWRLIYTTALLLKHKNLVNDREKSFLLDELIRFLHDDSVGNKSFSMMPEEWLYVLQKLENAKIKVGDKKLEIVANSLIEEFSEISLNLSEHLGIECKIKLPKKLLLDKSEWQKHISKSISDKKQIICKYEIPDAADDLIISLNMNSSIMLVGMEVDAPKDRVTIKGKINWLLKTLKNKEVDDSFVEVRWSSTAANDQINMGKLNENFFKNRGKKSTIKSFTPMMKIKSATLFKSRKNFIKKLETLVISFYDNHGQYLKKWIPKAPSPLKEDLNIDE